jgi:hypothetical protein
MAVESPHVEPMAPLLADEAAQCEKSPEGMAEEAAPAARPRLASKVVVPSPGFDDRQVTTGTLLCCAAFCQC